MKYLIVVFFTCFCSFTTVFAQDKYTKHKVVKGETITDIAKKYKVTPYDIYRLNPDSQNGIKENTILLVPTQSLPVPSVPEKEKTTKVSNTIHEVQAKETLYSLSKRYNVSVEEIAKANGDTIKNGLQIGQKVIIPIKGSGVAAQAKIAEKQEDRKNAPSYLFHTVAAGETKYSIAKQYGMSLQLLEELNPEVKDGLPIGFKLKLSKNAIVQKEVGPGAVQVKPEPQYVVYKVQPKETFYSLSKRTGLTEEQIVTLNPEAKNGLKDGMELKLPAGTAVAEFTTKQVVNLAETLKKDTRKEIALLLPFNIENMEVTGEAAVDRLRSDRFLNMTLDFYAGALIAIDSAKAMGLPVRVRILDSKESKSASAVISFKNTLLSADAVIGPFFQSNVEKAAAMLSDKNIPVISPLSKDTGASYPNLFQSVPSPDMVKMAMLDYLKGKDGNVLAIVDPKKVSSRQFIKSNYESARFIDGGVTDAALRGLLSKEKMNYVILDSESTAMLINATKVIAGVMADYQVQLVMLEKNDAIDSDEIPLARLTSLKMIYPSVTKSNTTPEASVFEKNFKKKNNIFPNQFATRGFDVTFDVILRLFQEEGFVAAAQSKASEQVENKFVYEMINGGNINSGVYILQYNDDLSLTPAQ